MRGHIICTRPDGDQVLARLARYLAQGLGYTLSEDPDPAARVNVFIPYIDYSQRFPQFDQTITAAYFSHKDQTKAIKEGWWDHAAEVMDLRIITSKIWLDEMEAHGPTVLARPPIDPQFVLYTARSVEVPLVGISGMNYKDGRKGEDLYLRLVEAIRGRHMGGFRWAASGRGWPVHGSRWRDWDEMPAFYGGLDIYLCTSRVEGIPMPPLEALRCGTAVVIPTGVGMLDELPEMPGIERYKPGIPEDMERALLVVWDQYKQDQVEPGSLCSAVAEYTPEAWCEDIRAGLDEHYG